MHHTTDNPHCHNGEILHRHGHSCHRHQREAIRCGAPWLAMELLFCRALSWAVRNYDLPPFMIFM